MECHVGTLCLRIHVGSAHSLKDKRQVIRSLKDRLKARHNIALAEIGGQDSRQDSVVVAVTVANSETGARMALDSAHEEAVSALGRDLEEARIEILPF
ncbi:MAG: DUF503 domain-containing protein [Bryobacterales bacterium]|nr:DUF503 domain-containing protein [Bryobacterales bacterium]MDE0621480.1 DUF503 domain-containing protein [Bryobacterales bacterium]